MLERSCLRRKPDHLQPGSHLFMSLYQSVGATQLYPNQTVLDSESVMQQNLGPGAELFASHGGFSNRYEAPAYQRAAIETYLANHDPGLPYYVANSNASNIGANGGVYNRAGRGIPDVRYVQYWQSADCPLRFLQCPTQFAWDTQV